jgi:hypothetical protein
VSCPSAAFFVAALLCDSGYPQIGVTAWGVPMIRAVGVAVN